MPSKYVKILWEARIDEKQQKILDNIPGWGPEDADFGFTPMDEDTGPPLDGEDAQEQPTAVSQPSVADLEPTEPAPSRRKGFLESQDVPIFSTPSEEEDFHSANAVTDSRASSAPSSPGDVASSRFSNLLTDGWRIDGFKSMQQPTLDKNTRVTLTHQKLLQEVAELGSPTPFTGHALSEPDFNLDILDIPVTVKQTNITIEKLEEAAEDTHEPSLEHSQGSPAQGADSEPADKAAPDSANEPATQPDLEPASEPAQDLASEQKQVLHPEEPLSKLADEPVDGTTRETPGGCQPALEPAFETDAEQRPVPELANISPNQEQGSELSHELATQSGQGPDNEALNEPGNELPRTTEPAKGRASKDSQVPAFTPELEGRKQLLSGGSADFWVPETVWDIVDKRLALRESDRVAQCEGSLLDAALVAGITLPLPQGSNSGFRLS